MTCTSLKVVQEDGAQNASDNCIWIAVGARATILEVALAFVGHAAWNADGAAAISCTSAKVVNRRSFVLSGQATFVVTSAARIVGSNMSWVVLRQLIDGGLNER